ncbi:MAG: hypothetical protein ACXWV0_04565 [Flavisolibacter sp.]
MKFTFALILFLVTAAGSFIPCCETDDCASEQANEGHTTEPEGSCSPFFACAACPGSIMPARQLHFSMVIHISKPDHFEKPQLLQLSGYTHPRFQPPKFA